MPDSNLPQECAQPPSIHLTAEQAQILLRADLRNLAKKVQQGKPLSVSERNLLQSTLGCGAPAGENFAQNQVELARVLGINRKTLQRARKKPGFPSPQADGRWDVNAVREFLRQNGHTLTKEDSFDPATERARSILLKNQKLEAELAILRREWVAAVDVEKWGGELGAAIRKVVTQIHLCAPSVVGLPVAEAEARLKEVEDEILEQLHLLDERVGGWRDEPAV